MPSYLVLGGAGFLGSHIVDRLIARSQISLSAAISVSVFDLHSPTPHDTHPGVKYYTGSITSYDALRACLLASKPKVVFHVASPVHGLPSHVYSEVNVEGTKTLLRVCRELGVKKLVYTSSTGVVWFGDDIVGKNEEWFEKQNIPGERKGYDAYHASKIVGERLVLAENGKEGMRCVVLRPCGMLGERDMQLLYRLATVMRNGQTNVQLGDNANLIDYVYVGNVADAHLLAADKLMLEEKKEHDDVSGEVFFITNDDPKHPFDFNRLVWTELLNNGYQNSSRKRIQKIPRSLALGMAYVVEFWCWITGMTSQFNVYNTRFVMGEQWYDIEKARTRLGYVPKVGMEEAVERSVKV